MSSDSQHTPSQSPPNAPQPPSTSQAKDKLDSIKKTISNKKEKLPHFSSIKDKLVWKLKNKAQSKKGISKLGLKDIALWKNPPISAVVFLTGHLFFFMMYKWQMTLAFFVGRMLLVQIILCFIYYVVMRVIYTDREVTLPSQLSISSDNVRLYLEKLSERICSAIAWYVSVLLVKDIKMTITVAGIIELFNRFLARRLTMTGLSYLAFNMFFIGPVMYDLFEDEIENALLMFQDKLRLGIDRAKKMVQKHIPKESTKDK